MTPRLMLLTGPAAGDVAAVLDAATPAAEPRQGASCEPWWDEVRDYWEAPDIVAGGGGPPAVEPECGVCDEMHPCKCSRLAEQAIRSLPGGESWLVGLVLPDPYTGGPDGNPGPRWGGAPNGWARAHEYLPSGAPTRRLAILAPEPPPLLVERVRAWGGEVWECEIAPPEYGKPDSCWIVLDNDVPSGTTWPEAVRAALGEP